MHGHRSIERLLIANRAEIACRITRTCRALGIVPLGIYSDADRDALHTRVVERAYRVGPAPASSSYLDIDAILRAAQQGGADAIHPGYGFLSENARFAQAVQDRGLIWVGPPPAAIRAMGDKAAARRLARAHGVPTLHGYDGEEGYDDAALLGAARQVGFPLMVKAAAGGGGRGLRVVRAPEDLAPALAAARREAQSGFADDRLILERYLEAARHVEVQVLADDQGAVLHVFERDCSIQRRQQKLLEEAPSPAVDEHLRGRLGEAAVRITQLVDYRGAGTVEFLLDPAGDFYFLEMNTRLQVEHPVTEAISGLDLVAAQIAIAEGRPLPCGQGELRPRGHAIEVRVYAEDPRRDFAPATGKPVRLELATGEGVRVDLGYEAGDSVSIHYDALLAKLVVASSERDGAVRKLRHALRQAWIPGIATNLALLRDIADNPDFMAGAYDTRFLETHALPLPLHADVSSGALAAATLDWLLCDASGPRAGARSLRARWRIAGGEEAGTVIATRATEQPEGALSIAVSQLDEHEGSSPQGEHRSEHQVQIVRVCADQLELEVDAVRVHWRVARGSDRAGPLEHGDVIYLHTGRSEAMLVLLPRFQPAEARAPDGGNCHAPTPGKVSQVYVSPGELVEAGAPLLSLEAMKMEQTLLAPKRGRVVDVLVKVGDTVQDGALLVSFEPEGFETAGPVQSARPGEGATRPRKGETER